ncbi:MAG: hypothetical protein OEM01_00540 [Desulfobulbaceae bacterium]|nr:hypothetical protein [Desulfobulbaceae bacterium]
MNKNPETPDQASRTQDIRQACIGLVIGFSVAAFLYFKKNHALLALIIASISASVAICAFFIPPAHHAIQKSFAWLAHWVGQLLGYILLVPLFYLFFVPARIVSGLLGKDPLRLKCTGKEKTYWEAREKVELSQYRRQF